MELICQGHHRKLSASHFSRSRQSNIEAAQISDFGIAESQGHPMDRFGKLSVRKALDPLRVSKGNFRLKLS